MVTKKERKAERVLFLEKLDQERVIILENVRGTERDQLKKLLSQHFAADDLHAVDSVIWFLTLSKFCFLYLWADAIDLALWGWFCYVILHLIIVIGNT